MKPVVRPRRNRRTAGLRALTQETELRPHDLVLPLFIHAGEGDEVVESMPGCVRWSLNGLLEEAQRVAAAGVPAVALFPKIDSALKNPEASEAANPEGLVPRAVRVLKRHCPDLLVITDVALDPYNSDGHDGLVRRDGRGQLEILNDETVECLVAQAVTQARAGADVVAPSDMMDGRVRAVRQALDEAGCSGVNILSYAAKYASAFYGPFRGALDSAPGEGDKLTYQLNPANRREAQREAALDLEEGADFLLVKPALPYLDILRDLREVSPLPLGAYQVSGEYLMIESASQAGWLDRRAAILESLVSIKRAGADFILSYFAREAANWLREG